MVSQGDLGLQTRWFFDVGVGTLCTVYSNNSPQNIQVSSITSGG